MHIYFIFVFKRSIWWSASHRVYPVAILCYSLAWSFSQFLCNFSLEFWYLLSIGASFDIFRTSFISAYSVIKFFIVHVMLPAFHTSFINWGLFPIVEVLHVLFQLLYYLYGFNLAFVVLGVCPVCNCNYMNYLFSCVIKCLNWVILCWVYFFPVL